MMKFYTEVSQRGNTIFLRGFENGKRVQRKANYAPYLFVPSKRPNPEYQSLEGEPLDRIDFEDCKEARAFIERYKDVTGMKIFGLTSFLYAFLNDEYPGQMEYDLDLVRKINLDIECAPEGDETGFPNIETANQPITAITCKHNGQVTTFGCGDYVEHLDYVKYVKCHDERHLLLEFIVYWECLDPDIITGWNIEFFDIPYIINRITRVMGEDYAKRLSPWKILDEKKIEIMGKEQQTYRPMGVCILDYLRVYKQFTYVQQESYRLDHIASVELGERKLDYSQYEGLTDLYRRNYQLYIEYNIHDVELVDRIEERLGLLALGLTLSYDSKIRYDDMFTSIRLWDIIIHNYLLDRKIAVPMPTAYQKNSQFAGAYVRDPQVGMHGFTATFDVNSLYPSLIVQNNMSPETYRGRVSLPSIDSLLGGGFPEEVLEFAKSKNYAVAANGSCWDKSKRGIFPELVLKLYAERVEYNNKKKAARKAGDVNATSRYHNLQWVKKIVLNSLFGATGHPAFRYYQNDYAEGITYHGQLAIRWVANDLDEYLNKVLGTKGVQYVIYCDTDSVFVSLQDLVDKVFKDTADVQKVTDFVNSCCEDKLEKVIEKSFERLREYTNSYVNQMKMKRENIANRAIFLAKKKYIMNVYDDGDERYIEPKLYMKGIEAVRSSTPNVCRSKIKDSLRIIMQGTNDELIKFIEDFRGEFRKLPFSGVASPRGCNGLSNYSDRSSIYKKGTPIHVRGALLFNRFLVDNKLDKKYNSISEGEKIKFCYMKLPNPLREDVFAVMDELPKEFKLDQFIDYERQFETVFLKPVDSICQAINWKTEDYTTLDSFFG
jgi:DNA polymerase elongation subunit (family B)